MNSSDNLSDNEVAFAAINLFANKPKGPVPDLLEIHDWHMNLLDEARAEQVLGHVANNPECFQQWRDICESADYLEKSPLADAAPKAVTVEPHSNANPAPWNLAGWLSKGVKAITSQPLPAVGGAVAATVLAVLIVPKLVNTPAANSADMINSSLAQYNALGAPLPQSPLQSSTTRSLDGVLGNWSKEYVEKQHFNHGLKQAFDSMSTAENTNRTEDELVAWKPWLESLPASKADCSLAADEQHCNNISADMTVLGQWALLNHVACSTATTVPDDFKKHQNLILSTLKDLETINTSTLVKPLTDSSVNKSDNGCSLAYNLITTASE